LIVHDSEDPHKSLYDEEIVLSLSDWYHDRMQELLKSFISIANPSGAEPVPQAALMNDTQNLTVKIQPGKTYLFRLINMGAFAAQYVWFEGHTMRIVEVDGVYTEPMEAEMIYVTAAQRYSVLVTAKNDTNSNFAFMGSMDQVNIMSLEWSWFALIVHVGSFRCHTCRPEPQRNWLARIRRCEAETCAKRDRGLRTI
jgi:iron transport multicopper oxidase